MYTLLTTPEFDNWLDGLKDKIAKARITARMVMAETGSFGDYKLLGGGVFEMRIDVGPGYRVYYTQRGKVVYLLLCGGDKSTQDRDIRKAAKLIKTLEI